jgi:hypothetical protein
MDDWLFNPLKLGKKRTDDDLVAAAEVPVALPLGRQVALYSTLVLGNVGSSFLEAYRASQVWRPSLLSIFFGLIVAMVLLPGAIDANKMNGEREELVQFAMVFTYGMGWQSLLGAAIQAVAAV